MATFNLVKLDPAFGSEIKKTRPCVVVSPDEIHRFCHTCLVAPLTSALRSVPWRVPVHFGGREGEAALDHMRAVDKRRLVKKLGRLTHKELHEVLRTLAAMFG